ncbi:MAG: alpha/beta hydrolase, partial [Chloroflexi bacterium]|nr:alpha/beta hydrolase [Chloroflexota bacterium]
MQTPRDESVVVGELRLQYRNWGGSGQPIVLLHGLASTSHIWDLVAPILANDFSVVALDQRGHGLSEKPDHGYDFAFMTADLHGFINALELDKSLIIGHSWGGSVALEYAVTHPDVPIGLCFVDGGTIEISGRPGATLEKA